MAHTFSWDETAPDGSVVLGSQLDTVIQDMKKSIRERMKLGGHIWDDATNDLLYDGLHAVNAGGAGVSPDIYKADKATKIVAWTDTTATFLTGYAVTGGQNFDRTLPANDMVGIDVLTTAKGYKHATEALRIFESSPVDALVNVKSGMYARGAGVEIDRFAGGTINISGAKAGLGANTQRFSILVLDSTGTLTWRNGASVVDAGPPTDIPDLQSEDTALGLFHVFDNSTNFVRDGADSNVFLIEDWRTDGFKFIPSGVRQAAQSLAPAGEGTSVLLSKTITTTGGAVLVLGGVNGTGVSHHVSIGRSGVPLSSIPDITSVKTPSLAAIEVIGAGSYTYQLRGVGTDDARYLVVIELGISTVS